MLREVIVGVIVIAVGNPQSTSVVDLTALAPRNRVREPATASSSGGSVGGSPGVMEGKGSIDMNMLSVAPVNVPEPYVVFEVRVRNTGSREFEFPVDPNLADFEPENVITAYAHTAAHVSLFLYLKRPGDMFLPAVSLYGSEYVTG